VIPDAVQRLVRALLDPPSTLNLSAREWNDLVLIGRNAGLLGRISTELKDRGLFHKVPQKARAHLHAALISAESDQTAIRFEVNRVVRALATVDVQIVLLKGAAYLMADLPCARGRMLGDLDLMVPLERIEDVEQALIKSGWLPAELDDYDQRFYREWMHEIPPLQHPTRETPIDLHHTIAPRTSRVRPDAKALIAAAVELSAPRLSTLGPADMVLHSAVHLFNDEVSKPLRDLFDLHQLLTEFGARAEFWNELMARAKLHGLGRPLYYALRNTRRIFMTRVPSEIEKTASQFAPAAPIGAVMDWIFIRGFMPSVGTEKDAATACARWLLYVRSHWLRMPPFMLARHLAIKAMRQIGERLRRRPIEDPE